MRSRYLAFVGSSVVLAAWCAGVPAARAQDARVMAAAAKVPLAVRDTDADGIADESDHCLYEPGPARLGGCPDHDGDNVIDREDQCPGVLGLTPHGCLADNDQDGILLPRDKCPNEAESKNGFDDADGCPDALPDAVQKLTGVIAGLEFNVGKGTLRPASSGVLDEAATILEQYPDLKLEIAGHSDDTGDREYNVKLSQQRADSVKSYLVSRGIAAERIRARGAGPDEPLLNEKSAEARRKNRRIEFRIQP